MDILEISKTNKNVTVVLSADELFRLCNVLHEVKEYRHDNLHHTLYKELLIANDLCQYGCIDDYSWSEIVKCQERRDQDNGDN